MKPQYMNETRGCVMDLENVIETLKAMDSTIRAKSAEMSKMSDMIGERDKAIAELWAELKETRAKLEVSEIRAKAAFQAMKDVPIMPAPNDYHRLNGE